jgi:uncharacterized Fe-S cluster-containing radical SAM superfamily protein
MLPTLKYAEFYITNVCNLTCPNCNRYNNLDFTGHYYYDPIYEEWAKRINLKKFSILGGEPTLNPHLGDWIRGARKCWPDAEAWLVTNGTYLSKCKDLDNLVVENNIIVVISVHNAGMKTHILDEVYATFGYCEITGKTDNRIFLRSHRGVTIELNNGGWFHQTTLNNFDLHDSDPENAHRQCIMSVCHHFVDGKLYKCGVVHLTPILFEQYNKQAPALYNQYQPLLPTDVITQDTLEDLDSKAIPQCKFCPENLVFTENNSRFKNKNLNIKILSV